MYLGNSNLAKSNSLLTRTKLVFLNRNLPQSGKSGGCGYRRRSSRIWHPAVLVKTRVWVGCTVLRAQKNSTRRSWCSLFEEWCVIFYNHSAWRVIFLLDFRDWRISFETTIVEAQTLIKNRNSWHHFLVLFLVLGGKDGAAVRALASQQCGPGSNPGVNAICGCWVCCWFSRLLREVFLRVLWLSPVPVKNQHFQIPIRPGIG